MSLQNSSILSIGIYKIFSIILLWRLKTLSAKVCLLDLSILFLLTINLLHLLMWLANMCMWIKILVILCYSAPILWSGSGSGNGEGTGVGGSDNVASGGDGNKGGCGNVASGGSAGNGAEIMGDPDPMKEDEQRRNKGKSPTEDDEPFDPPYIWDCKSACWQCNFGVMISQWISPCLMLCAQQ